MRNLNVNKQAYIKNQLSCIRVVDGDGLILKNMIDNSEEKIRFLGVDAPEIKQCRKLEQYERETHLAGQFFNVAW
jgi:micrococcal nuclease